MRNSIYFFMMVLFLLSSCSKSGEEGECWKDKNLEFEFPLYGLNFDDVKKADGSIDTSKLYVFFFDKGVRKVIKAKYELKPEKSYHLIPSKLLEELTIKFENKEDIERMYSLKREKIYIQDLCYVYTYDVLAIKKDDCNREIPLGNRWPNELYKYKDEEGRITILVRKQKTIIKKE